ncbi:5-guanidino-2-oxopentanoate decarboxylase [Martelella alba]|uniref:5-guanidino-2-oxopentanoate decarboxylase n=1 Tax=Martelella alba TaxID=2590451 RepID=A0A506UCN9_9HYPH|nr:5-guanidino-2-oxopentanoate decarboxylase [Martelella alba]TPW32203.1 5-guanidino-2-oxopentanoate decarboxylase [Martelella alba]
MTVMTVGEALVRLLERRGVEIVFGIPGVHTAELYRGLARSSIRHVTPRHEQGAGFMADGYARVTGKPGVAFVITGPGLLNTVTAMAQARADSIPMLVISGVNHRATLGRNMGCLHELPDQRAMIASFALHSERLENADLLPVVVDRAFAVLGSGRPGPVHIEIPLDVMVEPITLLPEPAPVAPLHAVDAADLEQAAQLMAKANAPVILAGGGAAFADAALSALAVRLDAPVITTTNGRGLAGATGLDVPASPSLPAVREAIAASDLVIAVGTEFGQTDYDMYVDGGFPTLPPLIRVDRSASQLASGPKSSVALEGDAADLLDALAVRVLPGPAGAGRARAESLRKAARRDVPAALDSETALLSALCDAVGRARFVGDSTQLVYAGNLYFAAKAPRLWFNAATGFGALGYGPAAAIGAALGDPEMPVIALVGDGGLQFSLAELATAVDEKVDVVFLVHNNFGYREIETFMLEAGIAPVGVKPTPPDMEHVARAYGLEFARVKTADALIKAVGERTGRGVHLVEYQTG